jgi:5'-deoxynucleotidase YfbR-like HD superfamily hydrolase
MATVDTLDKPQEQLAARMLCDSRFFIKEVTDLARTRKIVAGEDIYSSSGMKLLSQGTRLTSKFHDRLVAHKLLKPIEQTLSIDDPLDAKAIIGLAHGEAHRVPSLEPLLDSPGLLERISELLADLSIPRPIGLRLSVMQAHHSKLFQHSLIAAMLAMVLGLRAKLQREELRALAAASIFHDLGELYIDPVILQPEHQSSVEERRQIYAHPIIGFLILRDFPELPKGTARAVLQHHEQLNGCGYPYRAPAKEISRVSRYLAVAEVAASLLERHGADRRIGVKLRMNLNKYEATAITIVSELFDKLKATPIEPLDEAILMTRLPRIGKLFADWDAIRATLSAADAASIPVLIERVNDLRKLVIERGFELAKLDEILIMVGQGDAEISIELTVLLEELEWQIRDFSRETERFLFSWKPQVSPQLKALLDNWFVQVNQFLEA